ncbi:MAG: serine hydrolase [Candidatus Izemoplasmatales bacterium]|nr:serine hydrolase [Candidatus Izemoplasmatales bacterium]
MIFPKADFNKKSCKEANLNKGLLVDMFNKIEDKLYNIHSMILVHEGSKVFETYAHDFNPETKSNVYSISKSFTSVAIGILVDMKLVTVEDPVLFFFSDEVKNYLSKYETLKVKHLLTMTVGQEKDFFSELTPTENPFEVFFNVPLTSEPGKVFLYNNFASFMLSAIVTKVTGKSMNDFLNEYLYKPIEMEKPSWDSINDYTFGCTGLQINLNDMARFGHLVLNDGLWENKQIVSKAYLDEALKKHVAEPGTPLYYGYQFWIHNYVMAAGMYKQYIIIDKRYNIVFAMQAYEERDVLGLYNNFIVKAFEKGWEYCEYSLRDFTRKFRYNSIPVIEKEKEERYG